MLFFSFEVVVSLIFLLLTFEKCFAYSIFLSYSARLVLKCIANYLITESEVVTGKSQTEALPY